MYNLDINFLNDRPEYGGAAASSRRTSSGGVTNFGGGTSSRTSRTAAYSGGGNSNAPLIWGSVLGLGALGLSLAGWLGFGAYKANLDSRNTELQAQVAEIEAKEKERDKAKQELADAKAEIEALTSVFSNMKPWSAMSQDLRDRLPKGVQIVEIAQEIKAEANPNATPAPSPAPAADGKPAAPPVAPPPIGQIKISGLADNFDVVNDFLVVLQKSNFLTGKKTRIVNAELGQPTQLAATPTLGPDGNPVQNSGGQQAGKLPKIEPKVQFSIMTELADVPTSELLRELDRKGAVGLVSRIEALKEKGVIKP